MLAFRAVVARAAMQRSPLSVQELISDSGNEGLSFSPFAQAKVGAPWRARARPPARPVWARRRKIKISIFTLVFRSGRVQKYTFGDSGAIVSSV